MGEPSGSLSFEPGPNLIELLILCDHKGNDVCPAVRLGPVDQVRVGIGCFRLAIREALDSLEGSKKVEDHLPTARCEALLHFNIEDVLRRIPIGESDQSLL